MTETQIDILFTAAWCVLLIVEIMVSRKIKRLLKEVKDLFHE